MREITARRKVYVGDSVVMKKRPTTPTLELPEGYGSAVWSLAPTGRHIFPPWMRLLIKSLEQGYNDTTYRV